MKKSEYLASILLTVSFFICSCSTTDSRDEPPKQKFRIVVVGNGVQPAQATDEKRLSTLNRAQGAAMWRGAERAYSESKRLKDLQSLVRLEGIDDRGDVGDALKAANEIRDDIWTLAVIGHATSATTRAAASVYSGSDIPLLMPIATSPTVAYPAEVAGVPPDSRNRFQNCYRLPPADVPVQASAVAIVAAENLHAKRVYLVRDISPGAEEYSGPLYKELLRLLQANLVGKLEVNAQAEDPRGSAIKIAGETPDLIVFCGYGSNANILLEGLRFYYKPTEAGPRPAIILTDGAKISELNPEGFTTLLTFPAPDLSEYPCDTEDGKILKSIMKQVPNSSYEIFGYDAMLLLGEAIESCRNHLSRQCINQKLETRQSFVGACLPYSFRNGENILSSYYVYSNGTEKGRKIKFLEEISAEEITRFSATGRSH